jgi:hypothetical protein
MKLRIIYTIVFINLIALAYSQNWAVFNKNYRYNYSLENESYTTVVIFADSTLIQGVDTIYSLNRIATKCDSCWFYYPEPGVADSNYIMSNQPQFMQRRIVYSNNQYRLSDTSNYIIPRFLSLGNSWTFNVSRSITAQVISSAIKNYFGVSDSVNTILLSTNDSIIISKQFGIVKYPAQFGQQIYYTLRGIENTWSYDPLALFGEKVPNEYDFYTLKPNVIQYYSHTSLYSGIGPHCDAYYYAKRTILSSSLTGTIVSNSYVEDRKGCLGSCPWTTSGGPQPICAYSNPFLFPTLSINTYTYNNVIASFNSFGNEKIYNNQLIMPMTGLSQDFYVVKFGKTSNNHFYKTYGYSCFSGYLRERKDDYSNLLFRKSMQNPNVLYAKGFLVDGWGNGETFIEGYGQTNFFMPYFEGEVYTCTSTIIDGADTLGEIIPYGIYTNINSLENNNYSSFGPNPTQDIITINFPFEATGNNGTIEVKDVFGKTVFQKTIMSGASLEKINLQNCAQGIYFVDVKIPHFQKQYKVIKE